METDPLMKPADLDSIPKGKTLWDMGREIPMGALLHLLKKENWELYLSGKLQRLGIKTYSRKKQGHN